MNLSESDKQYFLRVVLVLSILINMIIAGDYLFQNWIVKPQKIANVDWWHTQREKLHAQIPTDKSAIYFLGNSIIERYPLQEMFGSCILKNRGVSGDLELGMLNRIDDILKKEPSAIFIEGGINDIENGLSADHILNIFNKIVEKINHKAPRCKIYAMAVMPVNRYLKDIKQYNNILYNYCKQHNIIFVDTFKPFLLENNQSSQTNEALTTDGLHLNQDGYILLTRVLEPFVNNAIANRL